MANGDTVRIGRRWGRWVAVAAAALLLGLLLRASLAPLPLPVSGLVAAALNGAAGDDVRVAVGRTAVQLSRAGPRLVLADLAVQAPTVSATIAEVAVTQRLSGRSVSVSVPRASFAAAPQDHAGTVGVGAVLQPAGDASLADEGRAPTGPVETLDAEAPAGAGASAPANAGGTAPAETSAAAAQVVPTPRAALATLNAALNALATLAADASLTDLSVRGGRISLGGEADGRVFEGINADVTFADGIAADVSLLGVEAPITAMLRHTAGPNGPVLALATEGLSPLDFVPPSPLQSGFVVDAALSARFDPGGVVADAALAVGIGRGTVLFGRDPPRTLDSAALTLSLADDAWTIDALRFQAGGTEGLLTGRLMPKPAAPWGFTLETDSLLFDPPDVGRTPVAAPRAVADGRIDLAERLVHIDRFNGWLPQGGLDAVFTFDLSEVGPQLSGAALFSPVSADTLITIWPPVVAHEPRLAVMEVLRGGFITELEAEFALTPLELDGDPDTSDLIENGIAISGRFVNATLGVKEFPLAVTRAAGRAALLDKQLTARLTEGQMRSGDGPRLRVVDARVVIPDLSAKPAVATIEATVEGPVSAVVAVANRLEVPAMAEMAIAPEDVTGTVRADLRLTTPLGDNVPDEARAFAIDARLTNAGSTVPIGGQVFSDANLEVGLNGYRIAARGRATIDGLTVDVNYTEAFEGAKSGAARFVIGDAERKKRGLDLAPALTGPVTVTLEDEGAADKPFTADFTRAAVDLPVLRKPAGRSLVATGTVRGGEEAMTLEGVQVTGSGVNVAGAVTLADGELSRASFQPFALSPGDRAALDVQADGDGYAVSLDADNLDVSAALTGLTKKQTARERARRKPQKGGPTLTVDARANRVQLADDAIMTGLAVRGRMDKGRILSLTAAGRLDAKDSGNFGVTVSGPVADRAVKADIADLGRLLEVLGIYERMRGGRATLDARLDGDGTLRGRLYATDLVLANETTLAAVVERAQARVGRSAIDGGREVRAERNRVDGLSFERLKIDFIKRGDAIEIREATLTGPVIGGTASGMVDLAANTVRLNGTFIPAYGVNNLFGNVPVVGTLLGGGDGGGLIGMTFRLSGDLESPRLLVNPISAMAPGIFRKIFEFR